MLHVQIGSPDTDYDWINLYRNFQKYVRPDFHVLEIGSSTVGRTEALAASCKQFTGVEYFTERLPKSRGNMKFVHGDWQHLTDILEADSINLAIASHVIEHVPDDALALNELYRVLRPGGTALINTPNRKRLVRAIVEAVTTERKFPWWEHVREYVESDLSELIKRSRFEHFEIHPVVLGLHGGRLRAFSDTVPQPLRRYANFWEIHLFKKTEH